MPVVAVLVVWVVGVEGVRGIVLVRHLARLVFVSVVVRTVGAVGVPMAVVTIAMEHIGEVIDATRIHPIAPLSYSGATYSAGRGLAWPRAAPSAAPPQ